MINNSTAKAIIAGQDPRRVWMDWIDAIEVFQQVRAKYLLY
jgi:hypothetical protein